MWKFFLLTNPINYFDLFSGNTICIYSQAVAGLLGMQVVISEGVWRKALFPLHLRGNSNKSSLQSTGQRMGSIFCISRVPNALLLLSWKNVAWLCFLVERHRQPHIFISLDKIKGSFVTVITGKQIRVFDLTTYGIL